MPLLNLQVSLLMHLPCFPCHRHSNPGAAWHPEKVRSASRGPAADTLAVGSIRLGAVHMVADCNIQPPGHLVEENVHRELVMVQDAELATVQDKDLRPGGQELGRRVRRNVGRKVGDYYICPTLRRGFGGLLIGLWLD